MTRVSKRNFGNSLSHAIKAADSRDINLKTIFGIIEDVKADIEVYTDGRVSIDLRDSQKHAMVKAAAYFTTFDKTSPILDRPTNQVIFLLSTKYNSNRYDLTVLELSSEGFPCTIYVDGNRLTAADAESFEENLDLLLSSPSTGEKLKVLLDIKSDDTSGGDSVSTEKALSVTLESESPQVEIKPSTDMRSG